MEDLHTRRLRLVAVTDESLASEAAGHLPVLPGVVIEGWPPEHWEPHVFPYMQVQYAKHPHTRGWHRYVVLRAKPDQPEQMIGTLGASPGGGGEVEFGYSILPAFQRQGYGTEAAVAFTEWLLAQPGVTLLSAQTYPELTGSIRVMESCGLTLAGRDYDEGTIRYERRKNT